MRPMSIGTLCWNPTVWKGVPDPGMWVLIHFPSSFLSWAIYSRWPLGMGRGRLKVFKIQLLKWFNAVLSELQTYIPKNLLDVVTWMSWRSFKFNVPKVKRILCSPESCSPFLASGRPPPSFAAHLFLGSLYLLEVTGGRLLLLSIASHWTSPQRLFSG